MLGAQSEPSGIATSLTRGSPSQQIGQAVKHHDEDEEHHSCSEEGLSVLTGGITHFEHDITGQRPNRFKD